MASGSEKGGIKYEAEDPKSAVGGEEKADEEVAVEEEEEAADKKNDPEEDETLKEDEGNPSEGEQVKIGDEKVVEGDKKQTQKGKGAVPRTPASERPSRERKTVDRYTEAVSSRTLAPKQLSVVQGRGIQLKDIPNVAYKLSKRKADDTLQMLHTILFGKKGKAHMLKRNISMFSGFVWEENEEEKQRTKLKEKLDKCVKEKLLAFADILNVPVSRSAAKKEELSAKLSDFLESPHVTTDSLLADKEKTKKRKAKKSIGKSPGSSDALSKKSRKKKEIDSPAMENPKKPEVEESDDKSEHSESEADDSLMDTDNDVAVTQMGSDEEQKNDDKGKDEDDVKEDDEEEPSEQQLQSSKNSKKKVKKDSGDKSQEKSKPARKEIPEKSSKSPSKSKRRASKVDSVSKVTSAKEKKKEASNSKQENAAIKKQTNDKALGKDEGKTKSSKAAKEEPTTAELHTVIAQILREVDFNSATLADILKQVGQHFGEDLSHRKSEVKGIITDVINNMTDDEEEDDNNDEEDTANQGKTDGNDDSI